MILLAQALPFRFNTVFQQLIKSVFRILLAHFIGNLSLGEADLLRRAMSGKMRSREAMQALQDTFFDG